MKYEKPIVEITYSDEEDIVCTSQITGENGGNGEDITGPWG